MAIVFSGLPAGMTAVNAALLPLSNILQDATAEVLRKDVFHHSPPAPPILAVQILAVRIENTLNAGQDVWLKLWKDANPVVGTTPPHAILRCRAGKIIEYLAQIDMKGGVLSYQVLATPGTKGAVAPARSVRVAFACMVGE